QREQLADRPAPARRPGTLGSHLGLHAVRSDGSYPAWTPQRAVGTPGHVVPRVGRWTDPARRRHRKTLVRNAGRSTDFHRACARTRNPPSVVKEQAGEPRITSG